MPPATVTADIVAVEFEARGQKYLADILKLEKGFSDRVKSMERTALATGNAMTIAGSQALKGAQGVQKFGNNTANLASQLNDIAVTLASGQSPFTVALQQGTQINQILGQQGVRGAVGALAGAFTSLINPVSLATFAFIALGGTALQALSSIIPQTESATDALKAHAEFLEGLVKGYESAEDAVDDYIEAASRLPRGVIELNIGEEFEKAKKQVQEFTNFAGQLGPVLAGSLNSTERELGELLVRFNDGQISAEELATELTRIGQQDFGILGFGLRNVVDQLTQGALKAYAFGDAINQVINASHVLAGVFQDQTLTDFFDENSFDKTLESLKDLTPELRTQQQIIEDTYTKALGNPALTEEARKQLEAARDTAIAAQNTLEARKEAEKASNKAASASQREREAVEELIKTLEFEQSLIGMTNEQKAVAIALRQAGAAATEQERLRIEELTLATMAEQQAVDDAKKSMEEWQDLSANLLTGFLKDLKAGKSAAEALGNVFDNLANKLIEIAAQQLVAAAFGAFFPGGAALGGLFGGLFGGGKASGGPVQAGHGYPVGERGPEFFIPNRGGTIVPHASLSAGGSGATKVTLEVQEGAAFSSRIREVSGPQSVEITRGGIKTYDGALPNRTAEQDSRYR